MTIGGWSAAATLEDMHWVPYVSQGSFYSVNVKALHVGDHLGATIDKSPIVDSGSTFTYLPKDAHAAIKSVFATQADKVPGVRNPEGTPHADIRDSFLCVQPPAEYAGPRMEEWQSLFPPLQLEMGNGVRLCMQPQNYLFLSSSAVNVWCVGLFPDSRMVIGAISLADFTVVFDHANNRLGFAKSDCDGSATTPACCGAKCYPLGRTSPSPLASPAPAAIVRTAAPSAASVTAAPSAASTGTTTTKQPSVAAKPANASSTEYESKPEPATFWQSGRDVLGVYFSLLAGFCSVFVCAGVWLWRGRRPVVDNNDEERVPLEDTEMMDEPGKP